MELPHVFLEIKISAKTLAAHAARKRLLVVVSVHVERQIVNLVKGLRANRAFVGLFPTVGEFVVLVVAFLVEALSAVFANERLVPGVDASVRVQSR